MRRLALATTIAALALASPASAMTQKQLEYQASWVGIELALGMATTYETTGTVESAYENCRRTTRLRGSCTVWAFDEAGRECSALAIIRQTGSMLWATLRGGFCVGVVALGDSDA